MTVLSVLGTSMKVEVGRLKEMGRGVGEKLRLPERMRRKTRATIMARTRTRGMSNEREKFCGRTAVVRTEGEAKRVDDDTSEGETKVEAESMVKVEPGSVHVRIDVVAMEGRVEIVRRVVEYEVDEARRVTREMEDEDPLSCCVVVIEFVVGIRSVLTTEVAVKLREWLGLRLDMLSELERLCGSEI